MHSKCGQPAKNSFKLGRVQESYDDLKSSEEVKTRLASKEHDVTERVESWKTIKQGNQPWEADEINYPKNNFKMYERQTRR